MPLDPDPETVPLIRLKTRAEFLRVMRARTSAGMPGLVLQAAARPDGGNAAGVGFTASRKVGNAVTRNRAKRRLRALSAEVLPRHAVPGRDYVLIARQTTPGRGYAALRGDLVRALKRLKLWRDGPDMTASAAQVSGAPSTG
jgi:ribonuclease P protein component